MRYLCTTFVLAAGFALGTAAASAATIDFSTMTGHNGDTFTSYTENGFTVAATSGDVEKAMSRPDIGDPVPSIYGSGEDRSNGGSVSVTAVGGGNFTFAGVDLANALFTSADRYTITGLLGTTTEFTFTGFVSGLDDFDAYGTTKSGVVINKLTIAVSGDNDTNIDNIVVNPVSAATPEPSSLMLLGSGMLSVGGMIRRRFKA